MRNKLELIGVVAGILLLGVTGFGEVKGLTFYKIRSILFPQ